MLMLILVLVLVLLLVIELEIRDQKPAAIASGLRFRGVDAIRDSRIGVFISEKRRALRYRLSGIFATEIGVNDLDQAWCRGNLRCHNGMHSQL